MFDIAIEADTKLTQLFEIVNDFPNAVQEGFSAYKASHSVTNDTLITNWSITAPSFGSSNFNASTGIYTVPVTGVYTSQANISYTTDSAITTQLGTSIYPFLSIQQTAPSTSDLVLGMFPIFYTNLLVLSLRTILATSTITLSGVLKLTAQDTLGLYYNSDSLSLPITLQYMRWATYRLS